MSYTYRLPTPYYAPPPPPAYRMTATPYSPPQPPEPPQKPYMRPPYERNFVYPAPQQLNGYWNTKEMPRKPKNDTSSAPGVWQFMVEDFPSTALKSTNGLGPASSAPKPFPTPPLPNTATWGPKSNAFPTLPPLDTTKNTGWGSKPTCTPSQLPIPPPPPPGWGASPKLTAPASPNNAGRGATPSKPTPPPVRSRWGAGLVSPNSAAWGSPKGLGFGYAASTPLPLFSAVSNDGWGGPSKPASPRPSSPKGWGSPKPVNSPLPRDTSCGDYPVEAIAAAVEESENAGKDCWEFGAQDNMEKGAQTTQEESGWGASESKEEVPEVSHPKTKKNKNKARRRQKKVAWDIEEEAVSKEGKRADAGDETSWGEDVEKNVSSETNSGTKGTKDGARWECPPSPSSPKAQWSVSDANNDSAETRWGADATEVTDWGTSQTKDDSGWECLPSPSSPKSTVAQQETGWAGSGSKDNHKAETAWDAELEPKSNDTEESGWATEDTGCNWDQNGDDKHTQQNGETGWDADNGGWGGPEPGDGGGKNNEEAGWAGDCSWGETAASADSGGE